MSNKGRKTAGRRGRKFGSELGWSILEAVGQGIEIFEYAGKFPRKPLGIHPDIYKSYEIERERHRINCAIRRLKKQELIIENRKGKIREFRLTRLGEKLFNDYNHEPPAKLPQGIQTIVSFDIPEKNRSSRDAFRRYLRSIGFKKVHRSVWISNLAWGEQLSKELKKLKIGDWVHVFRGHAITDL
ncbi:MAG: hypothetical protein ABII13_03130 [Patescibacteria group bacterium]|nr:hypothetical protein [Patescibacteria group bacterium]